MKKTLCVGVFRVYQHQQWYGVLASVPWLLHSFVFVCQALLGRDIDWLQMPHKSTCKYILKILFNYRRQNPHNRILHDSANIFWDVAISPSSKAICIIMSFVVWQRKLCKEVKSLSQRCREIVQLWYGTYVERQSSKPSNFNASDVNFLCSRMLVRV